MILMSTSFENFAELQESKPALAKELLETVGEGDWQTDQIFHYGSLEEFVDYELTEGWYSDMSLNGDTNGAPNLLDYIDKEALGEALMNSWDESCNFEHNGEILTTGYGW